MVINSSLYQRPYSQEKEKGSSLQGINLIDQLSWIGQWDCFLARSLFFAFLVNTASESFVYSMSNEGI